MNRRRLTMMAEMLEGMASGSTQFVDSGGIAKPTRFDMAYFVCGTSACALGHAAFYAPFIAEGLSAEVSVSYSGRIDPEVLGVRYRSELNYNAADYFFDLAQNTTRYFFDPEYYDDPSEDITPRMVAQRIRAWLGQEVAS